MNKTKKKKQKNKEKHNENNGKDILKIINSTLMLWGLEALFFLWTSYQKGILFPLLNIETYSILGDIIFRVIFYALYFIELYWILFDHINGGRYPFLNRKPMNLFFRLIILRIIFDIINLFIFSLAGNIAGSVITIITEFLFMFLCFYQTSSFITDKQFKLSFDKISIAFITSVFILICLSGLYFLLQYNEYCYLQEKYTASSNIRNAFIQNLPFNIQFSGLIITSVFILLCFAYFYFTFKGKDYVKADEHKKKSHNKKERIDVKYICAKVTGVLACVLLLCGVKFMVYPLGSFTLIPDGTSMSSGVSEKAKSFDDGYINTEFSRTTSYDWQEKIVLNKTFASIKYRNKSILRLSYYSPLNDSIFYPMKSIDTKHTKRDEYFGGTNVDRYGTMAIVFLDNDKPHAVKNEQIKHHKENDVLTEAVKSLISEGYWDYFEYGCDYLLKYEPEFIQPYIERYSNGDFTETELELNSDIKPEYITEFAKSYTNS